MLTKHWALRCFCHLLLEMIVNKTQFNNLFSNIAWQSLSIMRDYIKQIHGSVLGVQNNWIQVTWAFQRQPKASAKILGRPRAPRFLAQGANFDSSASMVRCASLGKSLLNINYNSMPFIISLSLCIYVFNNAIFFFYIYMYIPRGPGVRFQPRGLKFSTGPRGPG